MRPGLAPDAVILDVLLSSVSLNFSGGVIILFPLSFSPPGVVLRMT